MEIFYPLRDVIRHQKAHKDSYLIFDEKLLVFQY